MPKVDVLNINGQKVEELELTESILAAEISEYAVCKENKLKIIKHVRLLDI